MAPLIFGLMLFFAAHLTPTSPALRAALVGRLGENGYKGAFSLLSLAGLILIVLGAAALRGSPADAQLWSPPIWTRHLAFAVMPVAFIALVSAYIPSRLRDALRHPMLTAVALWAAAHLVANGDLLAALLFGLFLAFAVYDRISVAHRAAPPKPPATGWGGDAAAVAIGLALWAATFFWLHGLAGLPLLPPPH